MVICYSGRPPANSPPFPADISKASEGNKAGGGGVDSIAPTHDVTSTENQEVELLCQGDVLGFATNSMV